MNRNFTIFSEPKKTKDLRKIISVATRSNKQKKNKLKSRLEGKIIFKEIKYLQGRHSNQLLLEKKLWKTIISQTVSPHTNRS